MTTRRNPRRPGPRERAVLRALERRWPPAGDGAAYAAGWRDALAHVRASLESCGRDAGTASSACSVTGCDLEAPRSAEACDAHRCRHLLASGRRCARAAGPDGLRASGMCVWCEAARTRAARHTPRDGR